ncbi:MAG: hypothetical protein ACODAE_09860 [Gemmatimonadota bacterium]
MDKRKAVAHAAVVVAVAIAGPANAQRPAPPDPDAGSSDSVRALVEEARQIQRRLAGIQEEALEENAALKQEGDSVQASIEAAMREEDPGLERRLERLREIRRDFVRAREAEDIERARSLLLEARRIHRRVATTRAEVVEREPLASAMRAFEERMVAAMRRVDPETDALMARLDEIGREIDAGSSSSGRDR